ncbi:MAG: amidohydrolase [Methanomassiliicoccales archaeon]|nr:MAG: amidohydrolase [Methanomassiliicoccales archaeon]
MIIDFHVHIGKQEHWHPWVNEHFKDLNPKLYEQFDDIMNPDGLEAYLKEQGVDFAVLLAENSPITTGIVSNEFVRDFCKKKDMFVPFASIDPKIHDHPGKRLKKLVEEDGFKGLKLYPSYQQYHPNDELVYPLYEEAQDLRIPVLIHTGSSVFKGSRMKFANPLFLDDVAVDFPDLNIIMAHSGRGLWYKEAYFISKRHENIYMEISGLPPKKLPSYFPKLEENADKVIFGSDWPGLSSIKANIEAIYDLPLKSSTVEKILGQNAMTLLGLK